MLIYKWVDEIVGTGAIAPDTMSASLLVRVLRAAFDDEASRSALLDAVGIDAVRLRNPLNRFSSQIALRFFSALERHFSDPGTTLRIGEKAGTQNFSDFSYTSLLAINLAEVIRVNIQIQALRQSMFVTEFNMSDEPPTMHWPLNADLVDSYAPVIEFSVASYARLARQALGERPIISYVHFQHSARFDPGLYAEAFRCPVHFDMPETMMELTAQQLFRPSPHSNPALLQAASNRYRQSADWLALGLHHTAHSYFYLSSELDKSPPTLGRMASSFGMTERTLRRKLVEEGYPFRELLDRVRSDLCGLYQMENKRSLSEIALLLGYSDLSAFSRSYKRLHGSAPSYFD